MRVLSNATVDLLLSVVAGESYGTRQATESIRERIDAIDSQLLELISERARCAKRLK